MNGITCKIQMKNHSNFSKKERLYYKIQIGSTIKKNPNWIPWNS
uniref:Uncharacterized protein n=1 Tax=Nelumbo nucifera TaxID=4432 RepID=A0A823A585_NELNU|nr:TPA_asm: hypothetical protein HUJ06_018925 [Nelumbo nucifera]